MCSYHPNQYRRIYIRWSVVVLVSRKGLREAPWTSAEAAFPLVIAVRTWVKPLLVDMGSSHIGREGGSRVDEVRLMQRISSPNHTLLPQAFQMAQLR